MTQQRQLFKVATETKPNEIYVVAQQGGSSMEWCISLHDTVEDAVEEIREVKAHTYDAAGPYAVPPELFEAFKRFPTAESAFRDYVGMLMGVAAMEDFSSLEPPNDVTD